MFNDRSFFKSSDARGFLFFLLLTSLVAVLIKLSKEYTKTYSIPITISNLPIDKTITTITPSHIDFNAEVSGFSLLMNSVKSQHLEIDFNSLTPISKTNYSYDTGKLNSQLKLALSGGKDFSDFASSSIEVSVDVLATKTLPVLTQVSLDFKQGYNTYKAARIRPDSIKVVGSLSILETLEGVQTQPKALGDITSDVSLTLQLDTIAVYKELKFSDTQFVYEQDVAKYTEGSFSIPVTIKGAPERTIKIFPREVRLYFVASLEEYDTVLPTDFEVLADFTAINSNEEFVVLSVSRKPENVRNVRLETKQIKFIVVN